MTRYYITKNSLRHPRSFSPAKNNISGLSFAYSLSGTEKPCRKGKQVLHSEDANSTLLKVHQDKGHPNRVQLERLASIGKYYVEK